MGGTDCLDDSFYQQNHTIFNIGYAVLKLSNFEVKVLSIEVITALCETEAICSCISQQLFTKIPKLTWKANTASGTTLEPVRITPLELNIDDNVDLIFL